MSSQAAEVVELVGFLRDTRAVVRKGAIDAIVGLTASEDGRALLRSTRIVDELRRLLGTALGESACIALVNLCDDLLSIAQMAALVPTLFELLRDDECIFKRQAVMLLANLSQSPEVCEKLLQTQDGGATGVTMGLHFRLLLQWFLRPPAGPGESHSFEHVGDLLQNLTQLPSARHILLEPERGILPPLLRQISSPSAIRRRGAAGAVRNLCFETSDAALRYLLSPAVDVVTAVLLPLAGPDRYRAGEKDGMAPALFAPGRTGLRESEPGVRRALVEALALLSVTRTGRDHLRRCRAYPVVRAFHEWLEGCEEGGGGGKGGSGGDVDAVAGDDGGGAFVSSRPAAGAAAGGSQTADADDDTPLCADDEATVAAINRLVQQLFREDEVRPGVGAGLRVRIHSPMSYFSPHTPQVRHTSEVTGVGKPDAAGDAPPVASAAPSAALASPDHGVGGGGGQEEEEGREDGFTLPLDAPLAGTAGAAAPGRSGSAAAALLAPPPRRRVRYTIVPEAEARRRAALATQGALGSGGNDRTGGAGGSCEDDDGVTPLPDWTEDDPDLPPAFRTPPAQPTVSSGVVSEVSETPQVPSLTA
jgi:hypothetical protein